MNSRKSSGDEKPGPEDAKIPSPNQVIGVLVDHEKTGVAELRLFVQYGSVSEACTRLHDLGMRGPYYPMETLPQPVQVRSVAYNGLTGGEVV